MLPITRSILVQLTCSPTQGGQVLFPDVSELRDGVVVTGIEAYNVVDLATAPVSGLPVISAADGLLVTVTLTNKSQEMWRNIPFTTLISRLNGGIWKEATPFLVNFQRSKIVFSTPAAAVASFVVPFTIFYRKTTDRV